MKAKVVSAKNESELENQLNELLSKSWQLTDTLAFDKYGKIYTIVKKNS